MENEIKDNEYIRTDIGKIDKVINANYYMPQYIECEKDLIFKNNIVKHSSNLKDLIQCGDYVNGYLVIKVTKNKFIIISKYGLQEYEKEKVRQEIYNIETITTKEQFESISYKVETH